MCLEFIALGICCSAHMRTDSHGYSENVEFIKREIDMISALILFVRLQGIQYIKYRGHFASLLEKCLHLYFILPL